MSERVARRGGGAYSSAVRLMRIVLPLAAIGLMGALFLIYQPPARVGDITFVDVGKLASGLELKNPRFTGATSAGEPFLVRADRAIPDGPDPDEVELENVSGEIVRDNGETVRLTAAAGAMALRSNTLVLTGDVKITTSSGYEMTTEVLRGDAEGRRLFSDGPVRGVGPAGEITAGRMRATDDEGGVAWFEDGVQVTIRELVDSRATGE
ncbi:MAG: LPS export ABC transporter periplasmic protein LptC [Pseudomonadota bacterium]